MDFHEISYLYIFWKSVGKIQVLLKSDKNKGYFTWRPIYILIISRSHFLRMKNVSGKICRENQNTHSVFNNFFFNCAIYETMWKNILEWGRPQMTILHMHIACWMCNTCTATVVAWMPLNVTLYVHCLYCFNVSAGVACHHCSFQPVYTGMHMGKLETMF